MRSGSMPNIAASVVAEWTKKRLIEGTYQMAAKTRISAKVPSCAAADCIEYGSHGRMIPKPSSGGMGTRFSTNEYISTNPSTASAWKNAMLSDRTRPTKYETMIMAANRTPHSSVPTGPASDTAESHHLLRSAPRLM